MPGKSAPPSKKEVRGATPPSKFAVRSNHEKDEWAGQSKRRFWKNFSSEAQSANEAEASQGGNAKWSMQRGERLARGPGDR